jgi:hypothetical protein
MLYGDLDKETGYVNKIGRNRKIESLQVNQLYLKSWLQTDSAE